MAASSCAACATLRAHLDEEEACTAELLESSDAVEAKNEKLTAENASLCQHVAEVKEANAALAQTARAHAHLKQKHREFEADKLREAGNLQCKLEDLDEKLNLQAALHADELKRQEKAHQDRLADVEGNYAEAPGQQRKQKYILWRSKKSEDEDTQREI